MIATSNLKENLSFGKDSKTRFIARFHASELTWPQYIVQWWIHNCIIHPILGIYPKLWVCELHNASSIWLRGKNLDYWQNLEEIEFTSVPVIKHRTWWLIHNCVSHPIIGLIPIGIFFWLHDFSAKKMQVKGWI